MKTPNAVLLLLALPLALPAFAATPVPKAGSVTAELETPYEQPLQAEIAFGLRSYYLQPWRAYMDTWPASRWLEMPGVTFGGAPATARLLAEAGFRSARVEWGWCNVLWEGGRFADEEGMRETMRTLRDAGIRPLILLNAHHGIPGPTRSHVVRLLEDAPAGQRFIRVDDVSAIRPGYTGLTNLDDYRAAYPEIIAADAGTGRCELSAPLPVNLEAGGLTLTETRFRPFSGSVFEDGTPNPASAETMDGWLAYVGAVCRVAKEGLGTTNDAADAGFDLEVWNEYTFGSCFLDINHYFDPKLDFREPMVYRNRDGLEAKGPEAILPMTVDFVRDPANHCPGVNVVSGFSNQRPWDNLTDRWPGQAGISRHYYTGTERIAINPGHPDFADSGPLDKLGRLVGEPDHKEWHGVIPGSFFIPDQVWSLPEYWGTGLKTEFVIRDVQPFPSTSTGPISFARHFRYGHNGDGRPGQVWRTEVNYWRIPWATRLMKENGVAADDPRLVALSHEMGARWLLRLLVMSGHKGETTHTVFQANDPDDCGLGVIPAAYFRALEASGGVLTDAVRDAIGPQVRAVGRVTALFRDGRPFDVARKLRVDRLVEHDPRLVWKGDGTEGAPDRFNRDDFAILPFQTDERTFQIGYYVVTHDATREWNPSADPFDPARYTMPPQTFDITFGNLRGKGASVSAYDPIADAGVPVQLLRGTADTLVVRVESADYPRFLRVVEKTDGPMLSDVGFSRGEDGTPRVSFTANLGGEVDVDFGPYPVRCARPPEADGPAAAPTNLRTVKARPGKPVVVRLDGASETNDAVRLVFRANGLEMRWPQWDHDLRGVLEFALDGVAARPVVAIPSRENPAVTLPELPEDGRARSALLPGRTPSVRRVATELAMLPAGAAPEGVFPVLAPSDRWDATVTEWNGARAWRVRIDLDATMHPGERRLAREIWLAPFAGGAGAVKAAFAAPDAATLDAARDAMDAALEAVELR
ncbi:MAG: hypothetical protein ACOX5G_05195 [Kiritimatiellia bacterium]|jgi:hypothetical protein